MPESFDEAFPGGFEECVRTLGSEPSVDDPEALCGWLAEHGFEEIAGSEVEDVLVSLDVEFVSVVEEPAQNSEWLLAKSADASVESWDPQTTPLHNSEVLIKQSEEGEDGPAEKKAWAAVLTPEPDAHGDIVPDPEIEEAAHGYLKNYRKVDEDHNLLDGTGIPIESYIVRDGPETFTTPEGETKTHQPGTWIMGVELTADAWEGVKNGDYTGFSIYGGGNSLDPDSLLTDEQLDRVREMKQVSKELVPGSFSFEEEDAATLVSEAFGMEGETHEHEGGIMPGPSHEAFVEFLSTEMSDDDGDEDDGEDSGEDDEEEVEDGYDSGDEEQTDEHGPDDEDDEDDEEKAEWKDDEDPCWDGYVMVGTKVDENGNEVPRCVPEEDAEAMAKNSGDGNNSNMTDNETDGKLDELLDRTEDIGTTVEEVKKSVDTLDSRVDELEEWKKSVVGEATDEDDDDTGAAESDEDLSEEEVEEIAANAAEDAAEEGAQKALAKFLGLDDDGTDLDDLDDEEVVRKAKQTVGTDSAIESGSGEEVDLSFSGITENL